MRSHKPHWPPVRESVRRVTLSLLSLHALPKRGEERPCTEGEHAASHAYAPHLSGSLRLPQHASPVSSLSLVVELHTVGGFSCVTDVLPPRRSSNYYQTPPISKNGLN
eukprot:842208-Pleurochrysis_carterae.AAC.1